MRLLLALVFAVVAAPACWQDALRLPLDEWERAVRFYPPVGAAQSSDFILQGKRGEDFVMNIIRLAAGSCVRRSGLFIDVGANEGFYTMLAAAHGCRVLAFEPQPGCAETLAETWRRNERAERECIIDSLDSLEEVEGVFASKNLQLIRAPLSDATEPLMIRERGCSTMAMATQPSPRGVRPVGAADITAMLPDDVPILLAKVDTEGAELGVMRALAPVLQRIENLVVEVTPGWWRAYNHSWHQVGRNECIPAGRTVISRYLSCSHRTFSLWLYFARRTEYARLTA